MKKKLIVAFFLTSCVTPYNSDNIGESFQDALVIEGLITDQPGPYIVTLSKLIPVSEFSQISDPRPVSGASVVISDDQGNSEPLTEKSSGNYYTTFFQGVIGRTYFITVATQDGSVYTSAPEKMTPVGDFDSLRFQFVQNEPPPPIISTRLDPSVHTSNGFKIYFNGKVLPEQDSRVWWRWAGTYKIFTYPELQIEIVPVPVPPGPPGIVIAPDVDACSGFNDIYRHTIYSHLVGPVADCTCCTCWVTEFNSIPLISDPKFIRNGEINDFNIAFIEANRRNFYEKYYFQLEQLSVSAQVYAFWKNILIQKGNSSNLFQTPPPKIAGNIIASANAIPAIGYFAASAVKTHSIVMLRSDVPYNVGIIDTMAINCTTTSRFSTSKKPVFW